MVQPPRIHLFQGYGVELEYMIVNQETLAIKPIADELLKHELGSYGSDFENGMVTWSNELVLHVLELKSTFPENNLTVLEHAFADNVKRINAILTGWNAKLLPTGAHPFMDPLAETKLWPHESNEVYEVYNKIFDCRGHGWSNVQSTHLNLPFYDDEEFARLHAAVRLVLPILPALCASTPMIEGRLTGSLNTRLKYYKTNQSKIPSITGRVIPEAVFSKRNYLNTIYEKIKSDIAVHDPQQLLNPIWVNSRGAIPRFDRGSIEIRIMDVQECPAADIALLELVIETIKALVNGKLIDHDAQMRYKTDTLVQLFDLCVERAEEAMVQDAEYLKIFGADKPVRAGDLWKFILDSLIRRGNTVLERWRPELNILLNEGSLATRIVKALHGDLGRASVHKVYSQLADCLAQNKIFLP
ncbi:MAG: glutamate--cysteine ligase [Cyclobacteriaceae bacterium]|nr:glutamate--cysteine ligase [Cyclobacteriaceae bacterium]UYN87505.1 MAG: glutamate--cysteine ligase [Cyclobacteriaceae bacterium]